jgi:hypothetical protein
MRQSYHRGKFRCTQKVVSDGMRILRFALVITAVCSAAGTGLAASSSGINLGGVSYYSSEQPFLDVFKTGSQWITQSNTTWDTAEEQLLQLDASGWVKTLVPAGGHPAVFNQVSVLLERQGAASSGNIYPGGQYVVLYSGTGTIQYGFDAVKNASLSIPGRDVLNVSPSAAGILITITATDSKKTGDYIRNIKVVLASNEAALNAGQVFNPTFTSRIAPFTSLRFMDWMSTNNTDQTSWTSRPIPSQAFYGTPPVTDGGTVYATGPIQTGVPAEVMVALANQNHSAPWFNMPHTATSDYITQFAALVRQQLANNLSVYVEYSNETWNYGFAQTSWMQSQGQTLWPTANVTPFEFNRSYYGMSVAKMCDIWKNAWGADASRVICVMAAQAANTWTATQSMSCPLWSGAPCSAHNVNAIAIAPYFGYDVPDGWAAQPDGGLTWLFTEITQGGLVTGGYSGGMIKQALDWVAAYIPVAQSYKLPLVAYECGQSLVNPNDAALITLYVAANRDLRMGAAYTTYLNGWQAAGGGQFNAYNDVGGFGKWGSWGALENIMDTSSPKFNALVNFIAGPPPSPTGPTVRITSPAGGASFKSSTTVGIVSPPPTVVEFRRSRLKGTARPCTHA